MVWYRSSPLQKFTIAKVNNDDDEDDDRMKRGA